MAKIIKTNINEKGDVNFIGGYINFLREGAENNVVNIGLTLDVYNKETKTSEKKFLGVAFWDEKADRIRKAGVREGEFMLITTGTMKDDGEAKDGTPRLKASGFDFQRQQMKEFTDDGVCVLAGFVRKLKAEADRISFSIPIDKKLSDGTKETSWYSVTAKDTEKTKIFSRLAKMGITDGSPVVLLTSKVQENGKFKNVFLLDFAVGKTTVKDAEKTA